MIKSRRMRWAGHVVRMGAMKNANRVLVGKPQGKRPLGWDGRDWIELTQDRDQWWALVNTVMNWEFPEWLQNWQLLRKGSAP
jgi:hypothetical protein